MADKDLLSELRGLADEPQQQPASTPALPAETEQVIEQATIQSRLEADRKRIDAVRQSRGHTGAMGDSWGMLPAKPEDVGPIGEAMHAVFGTARTQSEWIEKEKQDAAQLVGPSDVAGKLTIGDYAKLALEMFKGAGTMGGAPMGRGGAQTLPDIMPTIAGAARRAGEARDKRIETVGEMERGERDPAIKNAFRAGLEQVATGVSDTLLASSVKAIGVSQGIVARYLGQQDVKLDDNTAYALGQWIESKAHELFPGDPARQEEFATKLSSGAGSMVGFMGPGAVSKLMGASDKVLLSLTAITGGTAEGASMFDQATQFSKEQVAKGGQPLEEWQRAMAFGVGLAILGPTEALPIASMLNRRGGGFARAVGREMFEEGAQEGGQQIGENLTANMLYDPEKGLGEGVVENTAVGAILGGKMQAARLAISKKARAAVREEDAARGFGPEAEKTQRPTPPTDDRLQFAGMIDATPRQSKRTPAGEEPQSEGVSEAAPEKASEPAATPSPADPQIDALKQFLSEASATVGEPPAPIIPARPSEQAPDVAEVVPRPGTSVAEQAGEPSLDTMASGLRRSAEDLGRATVEQTMIPDDQFSEVRARDMLREMIAGKEPSRVWGERLGATPEQMQPLLQQAVSDGLIRIDRNGVIRRTAKSKAAGSARQPTPAAAVENGKPRAELAIAPGHRALKRAERVEKATGQQFTEAAKDYAVMLEQADSAAAAQVLDDIRQDKTVTKPLLDEILQAYTGEAKRERTKAAAFAKLSSLVRERANANGRALAADAGPLPEAGVPGGVPADARNGNAAAAPQERGPGSGRDVPGSASADDGRPGTADGLSPEGAGARADTGERAGDGESRVHPSPPVVELTAEQQAAIAADVAREEQARADRTRRNYRITDEDAIGQGGAKTKVRGNIEAIRIVKQIEEENREATDDEKRILVKYVGWGAFAQDVFSDHKDEWKKERDALKDLLTADEYRSARASTLNAHFTSPEVIKGMWSALERLGWKGGRAIEPSVGIGHFIGLEPETTRENTAWTAVDLDPLSAKITKALYGAADVRVGVGFETQKWPDDHFDLAISNVPFGDFVVQDDNIRGFNIHDYFFVRSLDLVRPGGIVAFVTSKGTLDKQGERARSAMARKGTFLGAIRLPGGNKGAFAGNAGTEVTTDVIFFRKRLPGEPTGDQSWRELQEIKTPEGATKINGYFAERPEMMLGKMRLQGTMYGKGEPVLIGPTTDLDQRIAKAAENLPEGAMVPRGTQGVELQPEVDSEVDGIKEGAFYEKNGKIFRKLIGVGQEQKLGKVDQARVRSFLAIKPIVNDLLGIQAGNVSEDRKAELREKLGRAYDKFVKAHGPINLTNVSTTTRKDGKTVVQRRKPNFSPWADDPDAFKVVAIEVYDAKTGEAQKAAIFSEDIVAPYQRPEVAGPSDAIAVSLNETGRVDMGRIAGILKVSEAEAAAALGDSIYLNPKGEAWQTAAQYLSGDVVKKLDDARTAAALDPRYQRNVSALEAVQPAPLTRAEITIPFGASWVPLEVYQDFVRDVMGASGVRIGLNEGTSRWRVLQAPFWSPTARSQWGTERKGPGEILEAALNSTPLQILDEDSQGNKIRNVEAEQQAQAKVTMLREAFMGQTFPGATAAIGGWVWNDDGRATQLEALYNKRFNRVVKEQHDGSHLTFPGLARVVTFPDGTKGSINLTPARTSAVWRIIQNGNTLIDHVVGAGKTWTSIMAGMEMKRLGMIQRPMYVVPNHMLHQFTTEFLQAYPNAKLLVATKDNMSAAKRKEFAARIAADKWDGIIITHSAFGRIRMSDAAYKEFYRQQIDEMEEAKKRAADEDGKNAPTVKDLEKAKKRLETKLDKLVKAEGKDTGVTFEELGVDHLIVDEAHLFKNLAFQTRHTRVRGIQNSNESQRATDLFIKMRHLEKARPGRSAIFLTGTPLSNTMAEVYTMMRYLMPDTLAEYGISNFDSWAQTFGVIDTKTELAPNGREFRDTTSFGKFVNIPELSALYGQIADTQTAESLKLPRPTLKGGKPTVVEAELAPNEEEFIQRLIEQMERSKGKKPEKGEPNFLSLFTQGLQVATDMRLVDPNAPFNPAGKIAKAVDNIVKIWAEGSNDPAAPDKAQLVFLDMGVPGSKGRRSAASIGEAEDTAESAIERIRKGLADETDEQVAEEGQEAPSEEDAEAEAMLTGKYNLYQDIKDRLIEAGIPAEEIAFIHDAKNDEQKGKMFEAVREGRLRILIGSSSKMGVGTNVQKRLVAMHHIDAPWKPADVEQRDGRILRQGNRNPEVQIFRYITKKSFDSYRWQILENKSQFIGQFRAGARGVRIAEDIDAPLPEASDLKAAATGDPRIVEHAELARDIRVLQAQAIAHSSIAVRARSSLAQAKTQLETARRYGAMYEQDAARVVDLKGKNFTVTIETSRGGQKVDDRTKAGEALRAYLLALANRSWYGSGSDADVGEISGFRIAGRVKRTEDGINVTPAIEGASTYTAREPVLISENTNPVTLIQRWERLVADVPLQAAATRQAIANYETEIPKLEVASQDTAFPKQAQLEAARDRYNQLTEQLRPKKPGEKPDPASAEVDEYVKQAIRNLMQTSRTAKGVVDTSASAEKAGKIAEGLTGEQAASAATRNFEAVVRKLHASAFSLPETGAEMVTFMNDVAIDINRGILKEGALYRTDDSPKYPYTSAAEIDAAMQQMGDELVQRLNDPTADPVETAAWIEWRANLTDHPWADGVGKTSKALAMLPLMRAGLPLPEYRDNKEFFANASRERYSPANGGESYLDEAWQKFLAYYRTLMPGQSDLSAMEQEARATFNSPEWKAALEENRARPATDQVPGYRSDMWLISRPYLVNGEEVRGVAAAVNATIEKATSYIPGGQEPAKEHFAVVVLGLPGSGKSTISGGFAMLKRAAVLNGDDTREFIPEYDGGKGTMAVHEEASYITKLAQQHLMATGTNLVLEKTGSSTGSIAGLIKQLRESGYTVEMVMADVPKPLAMIQAVNRFKKNGRVVPPDYFDQLKTRAVFDTLRGLGESDGVTVLSRSGKDAPWIISEQSASFDGLERAIEQSSGGFARVVRAGRAARGTGGDGGLREAVRPQSAASAARPGTAQAQAVTPSKAALAENGAAYASAILDDVPLAAHAFANDMTPEDVDALRNGAMPSIRSLIGRMVRRVLGPRGDQAKRSLDKLKADGFNTSEPVYNGWFGKTTDDVGMDTEHSVPAFWFTPSKGEAEIYQHVASLQDDRDRAGHAILHTVYVRPGKQFVADGPHPRHLLDRDGNLNFEWRYFDSILSAARGGGYDSVRFRNVVDMSPIPHDQVAVFDRKNVHVEKTERGSYLDKMAGPSEAMARFASQSNDDLGSFRPGLVSAREEITAEIEHEIGRMLPANVALQIADRIWIDGQELAGYYLPAKKLLKLALESGDNPKTIGWHETTHALRDVGAFTDEEWQTLVDRAKKVGVDERITALNEATGEEINAVPLYGRIFESRGRQRGYQGAGLAAFVDEQLNEERVAKLAESWAGGTSFGKSVDALLSRMVEMLRAIKRALAAHGFNTLADVFEAGEVRGIAGRMRSGDLAVRLSPEATEARERERVGMMLATPEGEAALEMFGASRAARISRIRSTMRQEDVTALAVKDGAMFMFAGEKARTADHEALAKAQQMEGDGKGREDIWKQTGWFRGVDKRWRFEIDDRWMSARPGGDAYTSLAHPGVSRAYDREWVAGIHDEPAEAGSQQLMRSVSGNLFSEIHARGPTDASRRRTAGHELQHHIQDIERFAEGGTFESPAFADISRAERLAASLTGRDGDTLRSQIKAAENAGVRMDAIRELAYRMMAGEVEARTVEKRLEMTPDQRHARPPWLDYDIPEDQQIVRFPEDDSGAKASARNYLSGTSTEREFRVGNLPGSVIESVKPDGTGIRTYKITRNDGGEPIGQMLVSEHTDGRWEVGMIRVADGMQQQGIGTALHAAVEADLGTTLAASGWLTDDGYRFWKKRDPEAVKYHVNGGQFFDGMWVSPKQIDMASAILNTVAERENDPDKVMSALEKYQALQDMRRQVPEDAYEAAKLDAMFAIRGVRDEPRDMRDTLAEARDMERSGATPQAIADATGWAKDGRWHWQYTAQIGGSIGSDVGGAMPAIRSTGSGKVKPLTEIIADLKQALGMFGTQGRYGLRVEGVESGRGRTFRPKANVRGQYDRQSNVSRFKLSTDIEAVAHEGGHMIMERPDLAPGIAHLLNIHAPEIDQFIPAGNQQQGAEGEAFAEWFRHYILSPDEARTRAPHFTTQFEELLDATDPGMLEAIDRVQLATASADWQAYQNATTLERGRADLKSNADQSFTTRAREFYEAIGQSGTVSGYAHSVYEAALDQHHPFYRAVAQLLAIDDKNRSSNGRQEVQGRTLQVHENPYKLMRSIGDSFKTGLRWIQDGMPNYRQADGRVTAFRSPALRDALQLAMGEKWTLHGHQNFGMYLESRRAAEEWRIWNAKQAKLADLASKISALNGLRPQLADVAQKLEAKLGRQQTGGVRNDTLLRDRQRSYQVAQTELGRVQEQLDRLKDEMVAMQQATGVPDDQRQAYIARRQRSIAMAERSQKDLVRQTEALHNEIQEMSTGAAMTGAMVEQLKAQAESARARLAHLDTYMRELRAEQKDTRENGMQRRPHRVSLEDHEARITQLEQANPTFRDAADLVYDFLWQQAVHDHQAGRLSDSQLEYRKTRKNFYVPLARDLSDVEAEGLGAAGAAAIKRFAKDKRFTGSDRNVINPIETIIDQTFHRAAATHFNEVVLALKNLAQNAGPGAAEIAEVVEKSEIVEASRAEFDRIEQHLISLGHDAHDAAEMVRRLEADFTDTQLLLAWSPEGFGPKRPVLVPYWEGGERKLIRINDLEFAQGVQATLSGLGREISSPIIDAIAKPASILRMGVTTNPAFIIPNILRDMWSAWILTGRILDPSTWPMVTQARGLYHELGQTEMARLYQEVAGLMGGQNVAALSKVRDKADVMALKEQGLHIHPLSLTIGAGIGGAAGGVAAGAALGSIAGPAGAIFGALMGAGLHRGPTKFFENLAHFSDMSETATRLGVFTKAYEAALAYNPSLTPYEAAQEAAYVSRDLIDFGRRGSRMLIAARLVPFLNANIQGLDKAVRQLLARSDRGFETSATKLAAGATVAAGAGFAVAGPVGAVAGGLLAPTAMANLQARSDAARRLLAPLFKHHSGLDLSEDEKRTMGESAKAWTNLMLYTGILTAFMALYRDDDEYKRINAKAKNRAQPVKVFGEWIQIPKAFEWGAPSILIEAAIDAQFKNDPRFWERIAEGLSDVMAPPLVPQTVRLWRDIGANFNSLTKKPIVPEYQKVLPPQEQFSAYTSQLGIAISRVVNESRAKKPVEAVGSALFQSKFELTPAIVDYAISSAFGYWGKDFMKASNIGSEGGTGPRSARILEYPLIGTMLGRFALDVNKAADAHAAFYEAMGRANDGYRRAAAGYSHILKTRGEAAANAYLGTLETDDMRAFAVLEGQASGTKRRSSPLHRVDDVLKVVRDMQSDILMERLADSSSRTNPEPIKLAAAKSAEVRDILNTIAAIETENALIATSYKQFKGRVPRPLEPALAALRASDERVAEQYERRLRRAHVKDEAEVRTEWPGLRSEILEEWRAANGDRVSGAKRIRAK